jgi:acetoin utilization protein AcuB
VKVSPGGDDEAGSGPPDGGGTEVRVRDTMTREVITIGPKEGVSLAKHILEKKGIRHLPVVSDGKLIGIITDRDIRRALPSDAWRLDADELSCLFDTLQVQEVMTRPIVSVGPQTSIEDAASLMLAHAVRCLPVLDGERLVGILTEGDILRALSEGKRARAQAVGKCWLSDAMSGFKVRGSS